MRVIAGEARSLKLKTIDGMDTRPTTDRIKETLFNMINSGIYGCRFLDLFSGSGGIGIEALSRGAKEAIFVENNRKAVLCIDSNLKFTKLDKNAIVMPISVDEALKRLDKEGKYFDYIFMDPPYDCLLEKSVLIFLAKSALINESSTIIVEASLDTEFDYLGELGLELSKEKKYKTNKHMFIRKMEK